MFGINPVFIKILSNKLSDIDYSTLDPNEKLGKLGEEFVKQCVKYCLWMNHIRLNIKGLRSYRIITHYKANNTGNGGIDFLISLNIYGLNFNLLIEVKNWKHYRKGIQKSMFESEILDRFAKNDLSKNRYRVLVINWRNINKIEDICKDNDILIVPLMDHITPYFIRSYDFNSLLESWIRYFIEDFNYLLNSILKGHIDPYNQPNKIRSYYLFKIRNLDLKYGFYRLWKKRYGSLGYDVYLGKPYNLISKTHKVTIEYVRRVASEMRKTGKKISHRNTKEWRNIQ